MNIQEQLQQDLKAAMRGGDKLRVDVIRMTLSALKNAEMALVKNAYDAAPDASDQDQQRIAVALNETVMQETVAKEAKRRREAAEIYRKAGREDLAGQEDAEAAILDAYLPRQLTADELRPQLAEAIAELGASGAADMGKVMPALIQRFKGRADGRLISQLVREILQGK